MTKKYYLTRAGDALDYVSVLLKCIMGKKNPVEKQERSRHVRADSLTG